MAIEASSQSSHSPHRLDELLAPREMPSGDGYAPDHSEHFVQFYETDEYLVETMSAFLSAGLAAGDPCIVIATPAHSEAIEARLLAGGRDLAAAHQSGLYVSLDAADTLAAFMAGGMAEGTPDLARFADVVGGLVMRAALGTRRIHVFGEMVALLQEAGNPAAAIHLEALWNQLYTAIPRFTLCCGYPISSFPDRDQEAFTVICRQHTLVLPDEHSATHGSTDLRLRAVSLLQERARSLEREIAERRTAEERLRASETRYRRLFEASSDGILIVDPADGTISDANPVAAELLACAHPRLIGRPLSEIGLFADEQVPRAILSQLESQDVARSVTLSLPHDASGQPRCVELVATRFQADGRDVIQLNLRDVTEQRALAARTRASLEALLAMAEAIVSADPAPQPASDQALAADTAAGRRLVELITGVIGCRHAAIAAWDPEDDALRPVAIVAQSAAIERQWEQDLAHAHLSDFLDAAQLGALRSGEPLLLDLTGQPPVTGAFYYGFTAVLVLPMCVGTQLMGILVLDLQRAGRATLSPSDDDLALAGAVAQLAALVVERERLLQARAAAEAEALALHESNRQMNQFLSVASHELKTPLTAIKANIHLAGRTLRAHHAAPPTPEEAAAREEKVETLIERVARGTRRLERLVDDLLDVSRMRVGTLELRLAPANLADFVRAAVGEQRLSHPNRRIQMELPSRRSVPVVVDGERIEQVITNLLTNALKYSPADRPVAAGIQVEGESARVYVRDEGPGLSCEERERIWELYYRAPGVAVQSGSGIGLGLGLHISKTLIEQHQGQIGVESTPGQGSTFWFTLPLASHPAE